MQKQFTNIKTVHINGPFFAEMNTMDTMDFAFAFFGPIRGMPHNSLG